MERGLGFFRYELMSNIVIRYIANAKKKADNYKVDALRYRGVVYKQLVKWAYREVQVLPPVLVRAGTPTPLAV